ncbi:glycosyltransferase family 4 protein [Oceanirhabdus seepicola]|uniref:Glycosyltransferase family 4 protein n=1 Tax=Oceanirhabdus seepicola TaxID=2828781 RepID=A0A9J6P253_9CLOT|nr:glycosyltransferase family 4 protein [Oceanirhabdus seepicola]MCM1990270.1 glycosyltransferase family 4 protein [Oceanirhabdus seepicola]
MKILLISQFFYPEITAGAFRAFEHAKIWSDNGNEVTVYTANPNYPKGIIYEGYENKLFKKIKYDGIELIRGKVHVGKNSSKIGRALIGISFMLFAIMNLVLNRKKIGKKFDVIIGSSGPIFTGIVAYFYSKAYKSKFIYEIRDITYTQMLATMSSESSYAYKFFKWLELLLCKKADKVVVVTNGFKDQLIEDGIQTEKIEVIYNGIEMIDNCNSKSTEPNCFIEERIRDDKLVFCYAGTFGISQDILSLVEFYNNLDIKNKELILIGEGAEKDKIENYISLNNIQNIQVYDSVKKDELNEMLKKVDLCFVKLKYNNHFSRTMPSKVFDLMYRGMPIVYLGPEGEVSKVLNEANCGMSLCDFDNKKNVKELMREYQAYNNMTCFKEAILQLGNNGFRYVKNNFDRKKLASQYQKNIWSSS